jgi:tRNA 2-thiouridine synthesizing protein B
MLHIINKSPFDKNSLEKCLGLAKNGSDVLLIEDGIFGALSGTTWTDKVKEAMNNVNIHVLSGDLNARGMTDKDVIEGVKIVDYNDFVDLTVANNTVQSWL